MTGGPRIVVVGPSGAGKSTAARRIAAALEIPHVELDAIFWGPEWTKRPMDACRADLAAATTGDAWIVDGNYREMRDVVWPRATMVVWLDVPWLRTMGQILVRTFRRSATGQRVCGDNRETFGRALFSSDSVVHYAAVTLHRRRAEYHALLGFAGPEERSPLLPADVLIRVLRRPEHVERVIDELLDAKTDAARHTVVG
ncbi:MAG: adenylate kinase [Phycisphaerales bacterium]